MNAIVLESTRTHFSGESNRYAHFLALFEGVAAEQDIPVAGIRAGYHPSGYGPFFDIKIISDETHSIATFSCINTCE